MRIAICLLFFWNIALAQNKVKTDCNTIYVCVDSASCNAIFSNAYVKEKLFVCVRKSTTTNNDSYSGNYLIGKSATIEFLQPQKSHQNGDKLDDFGIEFKTRQIGNLTTILEQSIKEKCQLDTITNKIILADTTVSWYKELAFKKKNFELSVVEYQKEYLKYMGFSEDEMASEMTFEQFNTHLSNGRKYPKQFSKIISVTVLVPEKELKTFQQYCALNQMKKGKNCFYNNDFKIIYKTAKIHAQAVIKEIAFELIEPQPKQITQRFNRVTLDVSGNKGRFIFNQ